MNTFVATRDGDFSDPTIWDKRPDSYEDSIFDANGFKVKLPSVTRCQTLKNTNGGLFYFDPNEKDCNLFASVEPTYNPIVVAGRSPDNVKQQRTEQIKLV